MTTTSRALLSLSIPLLMFIALPSPAHADYQIPDNKTAVLRFTSSNTVPGSCTGSGPFGWTAARPDAGTWTVPVALNTLSLYIPYTFTYTCTSTADSNQAGAPVTASAPMVVVPGQQVKVSFSPSVQTNPLQFTPTFSFTANRYHLYYQAVRPYTQSLTLTWSYSDRYGTCTAGGTDPRWTGTKSVSGTQTFGNDALESDYLQRTYTLSCTSRNAQGGSGQQTVIFEGPPCPDWPACNNR
jgi:hypothetical protein